jgi:iron complex outermembrane receptor protein
MMRWEPISRLRLTLGTEDKVVLRAAYSDRTEDGVTTSDDAPFHVLSGFVQSELQLMPTAMLVTGVRADRYSTVGSAVTPRLGLVITPTTRTTVKLLYGEAFRAPSAAQAYLTAGVYEANASLVSERIATTELNVQQRLGAGILVGLSAYRYMLHDLIDQRSLDVYAVRYENLSEASAKGVEVQLDARPSGPVSGQFTYALQKSADAAGFTLTNSPRQVATLGVTARAIDGLRAAAQFRHESGRRTIKSSTSSFLRTDTNVSYLPRMLGTSAFRGLEIGLRVTNLFDVSYATPAGSGNEQDSIVADGRTYALRLEWRF